MSEAALTEIKSSPVEDKFLELEDHTVHDPFGLRISNNTTKRSRKLNPEDVIAHEVA